MKKLIALVLVFMLCAAALGEIDVAALNGPTGMGLVKLMADEEGSGKYQSCCAAASGKQQSGLLVIPLYSQTEIRWGTGEKEPAAEAGQTALYAPGNEYVRYYTLTFLWPDGSEGKNKTVASVPGGTEIQFVFFSICDNERNFFTIFV